MKERPILFRGEMVRAILDGRKTMTRRVVKVDNHSANLDTYFMDGEPSVLGMQFTDGTKVKCPYGKVGDRLWVRESFSAWFDCFHWYDIDRSERKQSKCDQVFYRATHHFPDDDQRWIPSIFMSQWASRLTLEITNVRVERLNDISAEDVEAEGLQNPNGGQGVNYHWRNEMPWIFEDLWNKINGKKHPWASNPWCWVIEFKVLCN